MTKTVFAAIAGRPNAGKSSLLNSLIGEKIAVVSDKPQTTRTKITGVLTKEELQYVFIDTPGIQKPRNKLGVHMNRSIRESSSGADVIIFVSDITRKSNEEEIKLLESFISSKTPVILALNKIDLIENKENIAVSIAAFSEKYDFASVIPMSVKENDGVDIVLEEAAKFAAEGPHYYPDDKFTDQPEQILASEMIRGRILETMYDEIPHGIAVTIEKMSERVSRGGEDILDIDAVIYCEKDSHKGMIIGKKGAVLKEIGGKARTDLEDFFRIKVNLKMWLKVKEDWRNREFLIKDFGLANNSNNK